MLSFVVVHSVTVLHHHYFVVLIDKRVTCLITIWLSLGGAQVLLSATSLAVVHETHHCFDRMLRQVLWLQLLLVVVVVLVLPHSPTN